jgi:hypothetical protein
MHLWRQLGAMSASAGPLRYILRGDGLTTSNEEITWAERRFCSNFWEAIMSQRVSVGRVRSGTRSLAAGNVPISGAEPETKKKRVTRAPKRTNRKKGSAALKPDAYIGHSPE